MNLMTCDNFIEDTNCVPTYCLGVEHELVNNSLL